MVGLHREVANDHRPQFVSWEFEEHMELHGIRHVQSAPYHLVKNGIAEQFL